MSFATPKIQMPAMPQMPSMPAPPPTFGTPATPGTKPGQKRTEPTFLGGGLFANPSNTGQKTLLGQ